MDSQTAKTNGQNIANNILARKISEIKYQVALLDKDIESNEYDYKYIVKSSATDFLEGKGVSIDLLSEIKNKIAQCKSKKSIYEDVLAYLESPAEEQI